MNHTPIPETDDDFLTRIEKIDAARGEPDWWERAARKYTMRDLELRQGLIDALNRLAEALERRS
jgi:hypothetical protein